MKSHAPIGTSDLHFALNLLDTATGRHFRQTRFHNVHASVGAARASVPALDALLRRAADCPQLHDRSMVSPAAYFVDLMRVIADHLTGPPLLLLRARRPDLFTLPLDTAASDAEVPYLSQVNAAMAMRLAAAAPPRQGVADEQAGMRALTTLVRFAASERVALPYNPKRHEVLSYLRYFGTDLAEIHALLLPDDEDGRMAVAREQLGLSPEEYALITAPYAQLTEAQFEAQLGRAYGLRQGETLSSVKLHPNNAGRIDVGVLLRQTGMTRQELQELLFRSRVEESRDLMLNQLVDSDDGRGPAVMRLVTYRSEKTGEVGEYIQDITLQKLHVISRIVRLARRLGWSFADLDAALQAVPPGVRVRGELEIDAPAIRRLAMMKTCQQRFGLPVDVLVAFAADMPKFSGQPGIFVGGEALYWRVYRKDYHGGERVFDWPAHDDPVSAAIRAELRERLRVDDGDLDRMLRFATDHVPMDTVETLDKASRGAGMALTVSNLTWLYRVKTAAEVLRLRISDVLTLLRLGSLKLTCLDDLVALADLAAWMASLRLTASQLRYLATNEPAGRDVDPGYDAAAVLPILRGVAAAIADLTPRRGKQRLVQALAAFLRAREDELRPLLDDDAVSAAVDYMVGNPEPEEAFFEHLAQMVDGLARGLGVARALGLAAGDVTWFVAFRPSAPAPALEALRAIHLAKVHGLLTGAIGEQPLAVFQALVEDEAVRSAPGGSDQLRGLLEPSVQRLCAVTGWDAQHLVALLADDACRMNWQGSQERGGPLGLVRALVAIKRCLELAANLGVGVPVLFELRNLAIAPSALLPDGTESAHSVTSWEMHTKAAAGLLAAVRAKHGEAQWKSSGAALTDKVDERSRDALATALIHRLGGDATLAAACGPIATFEDLSKYLLVDVEMGSCTTISPVKLALNSLQLYVHRCRTGLEPGVVGEIPEHEWTWRSHYRVWEANRKVFLYPENFLEPSLRTGKTPLFAALQSTLLRGEVTADAVKDACTNYVEALDQLARLDIAGSCFCPVSRPAKDQPEFSHVLAASADEAATLDSSTLSAELQAVFRDAGMALSAQAAITVDEAQHRWRVRDGGATYLLRRHGKRIHVHRHNPPVTTDTLFLVGRTNAHPRIFYWRSAAMDCSGAVPAVVRWQPWQRIELTLLAEAVTPVFAFGKLFLFWVERRSEVITQGEGPARTSTSTTKASVRFSFLGLRDRWATVQPVPNMQDIALHAGQEDAREWRSAHAVRLPATNDSAERLYVAFGPVTVANPSAEDGDESTKGVTFGHHAVFNSDLDCPANEGQGAVLGQVFQRFNKRYLMCGPKIALKWSKPPTINVEAKLPYDHVLVLQTVPGILSDSEGWLIDDTRKQSLPMDLLSQTVLFDPPAKKLEGLDPQATIVPVRNMPGWGILENAGEVFLVAVQQDGIGPYSESLRYDWKSKLFACPPNLPGSVKTTFIRLGATRIRDLHHILISQGVKRLLSPRSQKLREPDFQNLRPVFDVVKDVDKPKEAGTLDFNGPFGVYYWELFFHAPMLIAAALSRNGRFEEAKKWYELIFNPTAPREPDGHAGDHEADRFWQFLPFRNRTADGLFEMLADPLACATFEDDPFDPDAIARLRVGVYERQVVMRYIDNLLQWADALFAQDSWESISQAAMLYVLAADLLGPRPKPAAAGPERAPAPTSFDEREARRAALAQALAANSGIAGLAATADSRRPPAIARAPVPVGRTHSPFELSDLESFFVPENDRFTQYWDRVETQLDNIRHCRNASGAVRHLALYEAPIDPQQLIRALASGGGGQDGLAVDTDVRVLIYRFPVLLAQAKMIAGSVCQLGASLLAAIEKQDAGQLSRLRLTQEQRLLDLTTDLRQQQRDETAQSLATLQVSLRSAVDRRDHYQALIASGLLAAESEAGNHASKALDKLNAAHDWRIGSVVAHLVPTIFGLADGGFQPGTSISEAATLLDAEAGLANHSLSMSLTTAQNARRLEDWTLNLKLAEHDIAQITQQIAAANLALGLADKSLELHRLALQQAAEMNVYYNRRFNSEDLYQWMVDRLRALYDDTFHLALRQARAAQRAFRFERNRTAEFGGVSGADTLHGRLLAGEELMAFLERIEADYHDVDTRELEIEKTISLAQLDPEALRALKRDGLCGFALSERLFDQDFPGHYRRKIASIAISIPALVGPYQNIQAQLTQKTNRIVVEPKMDLINFLLPGDAGNAAADVTGLVSDLRAPQTVAISKGVNDAGVFELNFHDERFMPFEGNGALSSWELAMPKAANRIDFDSISDVIIHLRYTALDGGSGLRSAVVQHDKVKTLDGLRTISLRQEFAQEWDAARTALAAQRQAQRAQLAKGEAVGAAPSLNITVTPPETLFPPNLADIKLSGKPLCEARRLVRRGKAGTPTPIATRFSANGDKLGVWNVVCELGDLDSEIIDDIVLTVPFQGSLDWAT